MGVRAAVVTPVVDATFQGGQTFFDGSSSSVGGNLDVVVTPVVKFSDRWSLFPTYHGFYQGTQEIETLAGGGIPFEDSTGHTILLKGVRTLGRWKLKPSVGGSMEWLRETQDEDWGEGLFDYWKVNGGLEGQFDLSSRSGGRIAYDFYQLTFTNYQSLESDQDATLSRELAGRDVLNNRNHMVTFGAWTSLPGQGRVDVTCLYNARLFSDQPVIDQEDQPMSTERRDDSMTIDTMVGYPVLGPSGVILLADLGLRYTNQNSNQNHFDTKKDANQFQADYYDFAEWRISPQITAPLAKGRWLVTVGGSYERRDYSHRVTQNATGDYLSEKMNTSNGIVRFGIAHALSPHTKLRFDGSLGWNHSNTDYKEVFRYNYRMANYGLGFSYAY